MFVIGITLNDLDTSVYETIWNRLVTSNRIYQLLWANPNNLRESGTGFLTCPTAAIIADMDASDTAYITTYVRTGSKTVDVYGAGGIWTFFQGYLLI